jgi:hypothetical protein
MYIITTMDVKIQIESDDFVSIKCRTCFEHSSLLVLILFCSLAAEIFALVEQNLARKESAEMSKSRNRPKAAIVATGQKSSQLFPFLLVQLPLRRSLRVGGRADRPGVDFTKPFWP